MILFVNIIKDNFVLLFSSFDWDVEVIASRDIFTFFISLKTIDEIRKK